MDATSKLNLLSRVGDYVLALAWGLLGCTIYFLIRHLFDATAGVAFSITLTLLCTFVMYQVQRHSHFHFKPHTIHTHFHMRIILEDLGLICQEPELPPFNGDWKAFVDIRPPFGQWRGNSAYYWAMRAVVLSAYPGIVHFPQLDHYRTNWVFSHEVSVSNTLDATLIIRPWKEDYRILLNVPLAWWQAAVQRGVRAGIAPANPMDTVAMNEFSRARIDLLLASLPAVAFYPYYWKMSWHGWRSRAIARVIQEKGWNREYEAEPEMLGQTFNHRYVQIAVEQF